MFLANLENVTLDYKTELFASMFVKNPSEHFHIEQGLIHAKRTGNAPVVLHFNGPAKQRYCDNLCITSLVKQQTGPGPVITQERLDSLITFVDADLNILRLNAVELEGSIPERFVCRCI
jgi:hypothetical protein